MTSYKSWSPNGTIPSELGLEAFLCLPYDERSTACLSQFGEVSRDDVCVIGESESAAVCCFDVLVCSSFFFDVQPFQGLFVEVLDTWSEQDSGVQ